MNSATPANAADSAIASGDLHRAIELLRNAAEENPGDIAHWMKLAALHRATKNLPMALDAVHQALSISPFDFTALLMKASLLQRMDRPEAGEAWGHALAQRPDEPLPPQLDTVVAEAEAQYAAWMEAEERKLKDRMAPAEAQAGERERLRLDRFRSNVVRRTRPYHSEPTHFHFPELPEREFHPRADFPWLGELEAATERIEAEFAAVMAAERAELVPYVQYEKHLPLQQWKALNYNLDWTAIHLQRNGELVSANARHCPETIALLERFPQPHIKGFGPNAMFSLLKPHTEIPPHVGVSNTRLVCHLPLIIPEGCWFRVGAETRSWRRGEAMVFDDTIEHQAMNPSDSLRVVLIFDVWNPGLSEVEKAAVEALMLARGGAADL